MGKYVRSARGEIVDFELLAIKAQLSSSPAPKKVEERKVAIDQKDGIKTSALPNLDMLEVSKQAAEISSGQGKQKK